MTQLPPMKKRSRLIVETMERRQEGQKWEEFIIQMLTKLELPREKRIAAENRYKKFSRHIASKLDVQENDVHVIVQGSMRTQTTIAGDGRENFDLDIAVKLSGPQFEGLRDSEQFFQKFGKSLEGLEGSGKPTAKNRCWRLPYPEEPFYFDVTPAIPKSGEITGTDLRVRDPITNWSPSNPEDFADWFCTIANKSFPFQAEQIRKGIGLVEARSTIDPIPNGQVHINDILRRVVQLLKLHRDGYYKKLSDARGECRPISVILVTLAAKAYDQIVSNEAALYSSSIEIALEVVDRMPNFISRGDRGYRIENPGIRSENFADKWNQDNGARAREFDEWHKQLVADLDALFSEEYSKRSETRIRNIFGEPGVRAYRASSVLAGLLVTTPTQSATAPRAPRQSGNRNSLA